MPIWQINPQTDWQWSPVHAMGLILLGLLRRSFDWPRLWNRKGGRRDWADLARAIIGEINCSSFTMAILEACLLTRPKESVLLQGSLQETPPDDDTTFDPPHIRNISELLDQLILAQRILQDYQITVYGHYPRQMIPVNLRQLSRPIQFMQEAHLEDSDHGF